MSYTGALITRITALALMLGLVGLSAAGCYEEVDLDKLGCPANISKPLS